MTTRWQPVCQWCGKTGNLRTHNNSFPPINVPIISGNCTSHPSGDKNAKHGPKWEQRG